MHVFTRCTLIWMCALVTTVGCSSGLRLGARDAMRNQVAASYGIHSFGDVDMLRYTFNVQAGGKLTQRAWTWSPGSDTVTFAPTGGGPPTIYRREYLSETPPADLKQIDGWFINDRYWLLFPLQLAWDRDARVSDTGPALTPIRGVPAQRVLVTYPPDKGYTPGDVYEIFLDGQHRLVEWIYHRGGAPEPTRITTWEDHRWVGPILIALDRHGPGEDFRVWFSAVAVKMKGSDRWIEAD
jgi:hypothetical protein